MTLHQPWHDGVGRRVGKRLRHIRKPRVPPDPGGNRPTKLDQRRKNAYQQEVGAQQFLGVHYPGNSIYLGDAQRLASFAGSAGRSATLGINVNEQWIVTIIIARAECHDITLKYLSKRN